MFRRYGIYFVPDGPLGKHGAAWLGWDITQGCAAAHPQVDGLDIASLTRRPRKYGLHATLKPPMVLAQDRTLSEFIDALGQTAELLPAAALDGLDATRVGSFLALTARGDRTAVNDLAAKLVTSLDRFRAPLAPDEVARRRQRTLTPSQERNLVNWGYPNVMDDFQFHITLTGPVKNAVRIRPTVAAHFAPVLPAPLIIDHVTLVGEDQEGMFHALERMPLLG